MLHVVGVWRLCTPLVLTSGCRRHHASDCKHHASDCKFTNSQQEHVRWEQQHACIARVTR